LEKIKSGVAVNGRQEDKPTRKFLETKHKKKKNIAVIRQNIVFLKKKNQTHRFDLIQFRFNRITYNSIKINFKYKKIIYKLI
jgi:hypothetical protein